MDAKLPKPISCSPSPVITNTDLWGWAIATPSAKAAAPPMAPHK